MPGYAMVNPLQVLKEKYSPEDYQAFIWNGHLR